MAPSPKEAAQNSAGTGLSKLAPGRKSVPPAPDYAEIRLHGVKFCRLHRFS